MSSLSNRSDKQAAAEFQPGQITPADSRSVQPGAFAVQMLSGWGRYPKLPCEVVNPETMAALDFCIGNAFERGLLGRGLGRSYGDAAISKNSRVVITDKLNRMLSFDEETGVLRCEAGLTFQEIIETLLPRGWFPAVTPGTKFVTMGGALASDIHGKNHHKDGSFVDFVNSFVLTDPSGQKIDCSRSSNSSLFWASAGGMGLTGLITELEIQLRRVETPFMLVKKLRCADLNETFKAIESHELDYEYSVSWIDGLAVGEKLGRSILILGRHATRNDTGVAASCNEKSKILSVNYDMPSWLLNRFSIGAFNELYYRLAGGDGNERISTYDSFFYPLDAILNWNRLYGASGFVQYQCVLPLQSSQKGMEEILTLSSRAGRSSFLAVLKKFREGHGKLSFPISGYTLTLDMPVKQGLFEFTAQLDEIVMKHGGRIYLAKDACLTPESFHRMYGEFGDWLSIKRTVDPQNRFCSNLSERLKIRA